MSIACKRWKGVICCKPEDTFNDNKNKTTMQVRIDSCVRARKLNGWFEALCDDHSGNHPMRRTFKNLINEKHRSSMPG